MKWQPFMNSVYKGDRNLQIALLFFYRAIPPQFISLGGGRL